MRTKLMCALRTGGAAATVLLLAGCSATHVGESWQCPLAQGSSCATIAEADPAVPASAVRTAVMFGEPLPGGRRRTDGPSAGGLRETGAACDSGCGPFAWLRELFGADTGNGAARPPEQTPVSAPRASEPAAGPAIPADTSLRVPEVLGRIWIAPFVDADGIYREAHWVRVVMAPAAWKLP